VELLRLPCGLQRVTQHVATRVTEYIGYLERGRSPSCGECTLPADCFLEGRSPSSPALHLRLLFGSGPSPS